MFLIALIAPEFIKSKNPISLLAQLNKSLNFSVNLFNSSLKVVLFKFANICLFITISLEISLILLQLILVFELFGNSLNSNSEIFKL